MKRILLVLLMFICIMPLVACNSNEVEEPEVSKIVVAVPQDPDFLDPHKSAASGTEEMMFNVFEGLLKANNEGEMINALAEDYKISDDGLTYTFTVRDNVKFHTGNDVTIEDVEYSYKRLRGDITGEPLSSGFKDVAIEVVNDNTIKFVLPKINASFLGYLTEAVIPANMTEEMHNQSPIGTGPYQFVEYLPSQRVVIKKFNDYWQKDYASIDEVEFRIFADNQTALISLQAGEVDIYPRIATESIDMIPDDYYYLEGPQNMIQILAMNNALEPLNHVKVRQAINYAIDVDEIINTVASGRGVKLGSNMSPAMKFYYQEGLENTYNKNVEKAKTLLKEADYENGFDITITVPSNYQFHVDTAQVIASQLEAVGINATIKPVEWGIWLQEVYTDRNYEMTVIALTGKLDPHPVLNRYSSTYAKNFINFANAQYDELMQQAVITSNAEERAGIYKQAQEILTAEAACVYIMDPNLIVALNKRIEGYLMYPIYVQDMAVLKLK